MRYPKLHIICGECGDAEHMTYEIVTPIGEEENYPQKVMIYCSVCDTYHHLEYTLPPKTDKPIFFDL